MWTACGYDASTPSSAVSFSLVGHGCILPGADVFERARRPRQSRSAVAARRGCLERPAVWRARLMRSHSMSCGEHHRSALVVCNGARVFLPPLCRSERAEAVWKVSALVLYRRGDPQGARASGDAGRPRADSRAPQPKGKERRPPAPSVTALLCGGVAARGRAAEPDKAGANGEE
jgi:hypothetical protein